ncbi:MAG: hypothetical protein ACYDBP_14205 [Leptospirales bacterium]
MLTRPQVQRYSNESGLRDIMIAEKEVVLTFLLQLLSERGILQRLAFKGGTCLRKIFLDMMQAFEQPFHGIQFTIPDGSYYETQDGLSWGGSTGGCRRSGRKTKWRSRTWSCSWPDGREYRN